MQVFKAKLGGFSNFAGPVFIFFISLAWFSLFARLDPDLHHDGIMIAAATAAREGLIVHRDVFQFHGSPISILQAWLAPTTGPTILSIRLLNAFFAALTASLLTLSRYIGVPSLAAYSSAAIWMFLANFSWTNEPAVAMSAVFASTLLTGAFLTLSLYLRFVYSKWSSRKGQVLTSGFIGGVLLGFLVLTRINVGLISLTLTAVLLVIVSVTKKSAIVLITPLVGAFTPIFVTASYYFFNGAIGDLWADIIIYPRTYHANAIFRENIEPFVTGERSFLPIIFVLFVGILMLGAISKIFRKQILSRINSETYQRIKFALLVTSPVAFTALAILYISRKSVPIFSLQGASQFMRFLMWSLVGMVILAAIATLIALSRSLLDTLSKKQNLAAPIQGYLALMAVSALSILIPWLGPRYVWWGIPLGLLLFSWIICERQVAPILQRVFLLGLAVMTVTGSLFASQGILKTPRQEGPKESILGGMMIETSSLRQITGRLQALQSLQGQYEKAVFLCIESAYSVFTGSYASHNKYHLYDLNWFPLQEIDDGVLKAISVSSLPVVLCESLNSSWGKTLRSAKLYSQRLTIDQTFHIFFPSNEVPIKLKVQ